MTGWLIFLGVGDSGWGLVGDWEISGFWDSLGISKLGKGQKGVTWGLDGVQPASDRRPRFAPSTVCMILQSHAYRGDTGGTPEGVTAYTQGE